MGDNSRPHMALLVNEFLERIFTVWICLPGLYKDSVQLHILWHFRILTNLVDLIYVCTLKISKNPKTRKNTLSEIKKSKWKEKAAKLREMTITSAVAVLVQNMWLFVKDNQRTCIPGHSRYFVFAVMELRYPTIHSEP
ncbi:hypothetical protein TNCV_4653091 [Trichonephila clavipes]|nr:hypothetical protein TNCV_4653091 [Trichonephila clavipes]